MSESAERAAPFAEPTTEVVFDSGQGRWQRAESAAGELFCFGNPRLKATGETASPQALAKLIDVQDWGMIEAICGQFALVVIERGGRCRIYADRFGTHRLYYRLSDGRLRISDRLAALTGGTAPSLDPQAVVSYLYHHMIPSPGTLYRDVYSLAPAEEVLWDGIQLSRRRWWQPRFGEHRACSEQQFADELMSLMEQVVADQCGHPDSGCFLSGGLDSSSISGLVAQSIPAPRVFSIGFPIEQYNEIDYARAAVSHFGLKGHEYFMQPEDVLAALPKVIDSMDQPFGNSSVMPTYFCAKLARDAGVRHLIAGDGGDELFAGNERYAQQLRFDRWRHRLGPLVGMMELLFLRLPLPDRPVVLRKAKSLTRQLRLSVPANLEYFNFLNLMPREAVFSEAVAAATDLYAPDRRCQALFDEPAAADTLDRMLYLDWKHTLADNDLVKVNSMCRLAGIDVAYPMLDDRLVDFSLSVPAGIKLTPDNLRHLYKKAMQGFLPDKIIHKHKHGFGLPFGLWTRDHPGLQKLAYEAIDSLKDHELFRPSFIDDVKRRHQQEHAKHYGELVWILMVLALWLDRHGR